MSDIYAVMDLQTLRMNLGLKRQQLAQAESESRPHEERKRLYCDLKAIQYYLSLKEVAVSLEPAS
jgi:hypothetical protein